MNEKVEFMRVLAQIYCAALKDSKQTSQHLRRCEAEATVDHFIDMLDKKIPVE